jgi:hypothetical protein
MFCEPRAQSLLKNIDAFALRFMSAYLRIIFQTNINTHDVLGVFETVKTLKVVPKFPKTAENRVVQALIQFGHRANMNSLKYF